MIDSRHHDTRMYRLLFFTSRYVSSTQADEGRKSWDLLAIKMQRTNSSGEGGEEPAAL